ncbi:DUF6869 domain-containing protein [Thiobacillus sp.]|uniref:DUF6869 domain-containing protein n=1 Tax=Thiobacillus sp. TaxID=924 RepID=UPI0025E6D2D4|nr:hypothetical protein [Thiobacillus sp.]MBT9539685.1 hypothetical protein [Thiobacillus sp.]
MIRNLAANWIEATEGQLRGFPLSAKDEDAVVGLLELILENPGDAFEEILQIIKRKPSERALNRLGAGPIEELLVSHPEFLEKLILEASDLNALKRCLTYVNADEGSALEKGLTAAINRIGDEEQQ